MTISDPRLAQEMALRERQLTALRAAFLIAAHHGVALRPEDLPQLTDGDMAGSVQAALTKVGLQTRLLERCGADTAATLGTAYPALIPCRDGAWIILITVMQRDGATVAAVLDPAAEAAGVQTIAMPQFLARWQGQIMLVQRAAAAEPAVAFGLAWFMPAVRAQGRLLAGVALAVVVGNLISFACPCCFRC